MYDTEGPYQVFLWYRLGKYQENTNRYHTEIPNRDTTLHRSLKKSESDLDMFYRLICWRLGDEQLLSVCVLFLITYR